MINSTGLKAMNALTTTYNYILRIELEDFHGSKGFAEYSKFYVEGSEEQYRLNIGGYNGTIGKEKIKKQEAFRERRHLHVCDL